MRQTFFFAGRTSGTFRLNLLAASVLLCSPAAIAAQVASEPKPVIEQDTLEPIVLVAKKVEKAEKKNQKEMFNKPYMKQVVSKEKIQQESLPDIKEAIRDIPGVAITETGAFGKNVTIRGLSGQRVVSLVDGVKIANQGMDHSGSGEINMTDINNVELIEVIKGSPAVIYDPGASGGVISVTTQRAPLKDGVEVRQKLAYDQGYDKKIASTSLDASIENMGAKISYSKEDAGDYRIRGNRDKGYAIAKTNALNEVSGINTVRVSDLGYESEALSARFSARFLEDSTINLDWDEWIGKDIASAHGNTMQDATIMLSDRKERESGSISYHKKQWGILENLTAKYNKQSIASRSTPTAGFETLDSQTFTGSSNIIWNNLKATVGVEATLDEAVTAVYSEQDYYAAFANLEYELYDWTLFGGVRGNYWATRQKLLTGANATVAADLIGISGVTPEKKLSEPTWALGAQYHINEQQNISLNISRTFRAPDLYERYAFSGFVGGGLNLQPEEGHHAELAWKYLDDKLALNASVFYSDFDQYIWTKTIRQIKDRTALENCIRLGLCNPAAGEYNDRESDFFNDYVKYYNADQVSNMGAEFSASYMYDRQDIGMGASFNKIKSDDVFVRSAAHPLDINLHYKYSFSQYALQPWVKLKTEVVFDYPEVTQKGGFDSYVIGSLHAGFNTKWLNVSGGIRNIGNKTYRAAYSGLNGLERTFFVSAEFKWSTR